MSASGKGAEPADLAPRTEAVGGVPTAQRRHPVVIACGLMLIAFNLRPALSSVGPLLPQIRADAGLSTLAAGLLTTLPVLALGVAGPLGPRLAARIGVDRATLAFLVVLAVGLGLRGLGSVPTLFLGSIVAAAGIGVVGVLLPGIVKRDFPDRAGIMTGLYTTVLCLGAAVGAGAGVPFERATGAGWPGALALWAGPALLAAAVWAPLAGSGGRPAGPVTPPARLWRDPLAWKVTGFMGLQSSLAYSFFGWYAVVLQERGLPAVEAGLVTSLSVAAQAVTALVVPTLAGRLRDQRTLAVAVILAPVLGFAGTALGPDALVWPCAILLGLGLGGCIGLALTIIVLRSPNPRVAAQLSAMSQGIGYCLASLGPLLVGLAHQITGGWGGGVLVFIALGTGAIACGLGAGRTGHVLAGTDSPPPRG